MLTKEKILQLEQSSFFRQCQFHIFFAGIIFFDILQLFYLLHNKKYVILQIINEYCYFVSLFFK